MVFFAHFKCKKEGLFNTCQDFSVGFKVPSIVSEMNATDSENIQSVFVENTNTGIKI